MSFSLALFPPQRSLLAACYLLGSASALLADVMPKAIAENYAALADTAISDEFNGSTLDLEKWAYRTKGKGWGTGSDYVAFAEESGDRYVSIRGIWAERTGSGIVTKKEAHFGFYSLRYRVSGLDPEWKTPWHPAVWMAAQNFATGDDHRVLEKGAQNVEIDFVEHYFFPTWNSHVIAWDRDRPQDVKVPTPRLVHNAKDVATEVTGWQELGIEYNPQYFQLWRKEEGAWRAIGTRVAISEEPTSAESLNRVHATPGYWILSNKDHFENIKKNWLMRDRKEGEYTDFLFEDSALEIDFFRYFPLKSSAQ